MAAPVWGSGAMILHFEHSGRWFQVNKHGHIKGPNMDYFSPDWILVGFSTHHWSNRPTISLSVAFKDPKKIIGTLVWDIDHGTRRSWGGRYHGRIPRVELAYVKKGSGTLEASPSIRQSALPALGIVAAALVVGWGMRR